jgi:K+-transporting ATPase ATPase C chain
MNSLLGSLRRAVLATLILAVVTGGLYPLVVWALAQGLFPEKARGSLLVDANGVIRGSRLIGQGFTGERYFHPRPSAAGANGYDASSSGGSNLGPTSQKLRDLIQARVAVYRAENGVPETNAVPADAVTASASGLDPHISPANAKIQATRVARVRGLTPSQLETLIAAHTDPAGLGFLGQPGVNVLTLNLALDKGAR